MKKKEFYANELIYQLKNKNRIFRISIFIWGVLIYAISFSMFFSPNNIVSGGSAGLSLIIKEIIGLEPSLFVLLFSGLMLIISYIFLGKYDTMKALLGAIMLPIFMEFSSVYYSLIGIENASLFLIVFIGGLIMGLGNGLILRSGFSVGGFQIIYQILYNKFGISLGKSSLWLNSTLIIISGFFFGFSKALYAIIAIYISSIITDKVVLETSAIKTFYIVTNKEEEIRQYILDNLGYGVTMLNAKGGYSNKNKKILMCAIPTRQYYEVKSMIQEIDDEIFFLITDTYEIYGGM